MVEKLEKASSAVMEWIGSIEAAGQSDSLHVIRRRGGPKTGGRSVGDKSLQEALRGAQAKQKSMELLVEAGDDDSYTL